MNPEYIPLLTFAGTLTVVVLGFTFNNSRIGDLKDPIKAHAEKTDALLKAHADNTGALLKAHAETVNAYSHTNDANLRRVEDMLLGKFAELDNRLTRIENHLHIQ